MEIKASSKYDWETIKKFSYFSLFTRYKLNTIYFVWLFLHILLTILPNLSDVVEYSRIYGFSFSMISELVVFYGFLVMLWLLFVLFLPKISYRIRKAMQNAENKYLFTDEKIQFMQDATVVNSESAIKYNAVYRVYETNGFLYISLITNKRATYIIDKSTVAGGTVMDLRTLLVQKIGADKYKIKCKI